MSAPAPVRWAISPHDGRPHAFDPEQLDGFADRGYAEAVCGHDVSLGCPIDVTTPSGAICAYCTLTVAPDVEDRVAMLAGFGDRGPSAADRPPRRPWPAAVRCPRCGRVDLIVGPRLLGCGHVVCVHPVGVPPPVARRGTEDRARDRRPGGDPDDAHAWPGAAPGSAPASRTVPSP